VAGLEDQVGNCVNADQGTCRCDEQESNDPYAGCSDPYGEFEEDTHDDTYPWDDDMAAERDEELGADMDGDFDSAMTSAGFGTDEDYGDYGDDGGEDF